VNDIVNQLKVSFFVAKQILTDYTYNEYWKAAGVGYEGFKKIFLIERINNTEVMQSLIREEEILTILQSGE